MPTHTPDPSGPIYSYLDVMIGVAVGFAFGATTVLLAMMVAR